LAEERVWVNFVLVGEPAKVILDAKKRGIAKSTRDAIVQALLALNDKMLERDLRIAQVDAQKRAEEERGRPRRSRFIDDNDE